jgi:5-methylthioadenosine/S-adenosylhomocysteine deaminase
MSRILLRQITVLPMTRPLDALPCGDLLIEDGLIRALGPCQPLKREDDLEIYDGRGKVALPGFVNAHTHLGMVFLRGIGGDLNLQDWISREIWPREAKLTPVDLYAAGRLGALEMIASGTTCFADMYFFMDQVARAVEESGLRASLGYGMVALGPLKERTELAQGLDFATSYRGTAGGRITTMLAPHAVYTCPPEFLHEVLEAAMQEGLGIHMHLSETRKEVEDCLAAHGKTPVGLVQGLGLFQAPTLAAHCVWLQDQDFVSLRQVRGVAHCQVSNLKLASGICPTTRLLREGVNVALGTDGASSNNRLEMLQEVKLSALVSKEDDGDPASLPAFQALQLATLGGARALGLEEQIGTLEVGKQADIAIFDFDAPHLTPCFDPYSHLAYAALPSDVTAVMVQGRWLYKDRSFLTLEREAVLFEARKRTKGLK